MTDQETGTTATAMRTVHIPVWFRVLAIAALLFELAGAWLFGTSMTIDPMALPLDQRAIYSATPKWMTFCWGVAIATGVIGAIALVARHRIAQPFLLVSWLAVATQFAGLFLVRQLRELTPEDHLAVPIVILLLSYGIWQLALLANRRHWFKRS